LRTHSRKLARVRSMPRSDARLKQHSAQRTSFSAASLHHTASCRVGARGILLKLLWQLLHFPAFRLDGWRRIDELPRPPVTTRSNIGPSCVFGDPATRRPVASSALKTPSRGALARTAISVCWLGDKALCGRRASGAVPYRAHPSGRACVGYAAVRPRALLWLEILRGSDLK
jgi:hypothetical protein